MPTDPEPYWGYEHQPFVKISTDEAELRKLADAIVRGASIAHAVIDDLRAVIEAVQNHPDVRLRPAKDAEASSADGEDKIDPTALVIRGGYVYRCDCSRLDIRVTLTASTSFGEKANFNRASFGGAARFDRSNFGEQACFRGATFSEQASFDAASFGEGASFEGASFDGRASFVGVTFGEGARFYGATFGSQAHFKASFKKKASFEQVTFCKEASFEGATFGEQANFEGATFSCRVKFSVAIFGNRASFDRVKFNEIVSFQEAKFGEQVSFSEVTFSEKAFFYKATFGKQASFIDTTFGLLASFYKTTFGELASFKEARFGFRANFNSAKLPRAIFANAILRGANFQLADISGIDVSYADFVGVRDLFGPHRATGGHLINEHHVQTARFHRKWDLMPWTLLRVIGTLRLFGVSYGSIIVIVVYVKLAKWYNTSFAVKVREDAQQKIDEGIDWRWREILANLPDLPVPSHLATQLIMIIVLAFGATFYQIFCPDLIKEATETRWTRQMNQPLIEYRSAMWSRFYWRYLSALLLVAGGGYTIVYLCIRLWDALGYLFIQ